MARTPWAPGAATLAAAARAVDSVVSQGKSSDAALAAVAGRPERAAVTAITLGTLRWYLRLAPAIEMTLARPAGVPALIRALLTAAAHQVEYSRNVPETTVHSAVDAVRILGNERITGLTNAVLRRFVAERRELLKHVDEQLPARSAHPRWLVERIQTAWPAQALDVLAANNAHPPMTLRVDLSRSTVQGYLSTLAQASVEAQEIQWCRSAVSLTHPVSVHALPGFADGTVSVQDAGAQLAAKLLDARPGMRILDACAAPGGKTGHILESLGEEAEVTAVDLDAERVALIEENLRRLRRRARLVAADITDPAAFRDGTPFERILVDAPCSSSGVIRRHPDIKLLRRAADVPAFAATQLAILRATSALLAPGGRLVYCTCSVLPEENEEVIAQLLTAEPSLSAAVMPEPATLAPGAVACSLGTQLLPGAEAGTDGFYYACLEKTTAGT